MAVLEKQKERKKNGTVNKEMRNKDAGILDQLRKGEKRENERKYEQRNGKQSWCDKFRF